MNDKIYCDLCGAGFKVTRDTLRETGLILEKEDRTYPVTATILACPHCGKNYVCLIDDEKTLSILTDFRSTMIKRSMLVRQGKKVPERLENRYLRLNRKLNFHRHELAKKFDKSFYQTEDGKEQLDYCYHAQ